MYATVRSGLQPSRIMQRGNHMFRKPMAWLTANQLRSDWMLLLPFLGLLYFKWPSISLRTNAPWLRVRTQIRD